MLPTSASAREPIIWWCAAGVAAGVNSRAPPAQSQRHARTVLSVAPCLPVCTAVEELPGGHVGFEPFVA
jgi:hypothetical protein